MIGSLRGDVLERDVDSSVLIEVGGVGYLVAVTSRTLAELEPGSSTFLHTHHHIRDDAQQLFGFTSRDERRTFQALIGTHGIGPALAMSILDVHPPAALVDLVATGDHAALTLVPKVGPKTAKRLIIELRDRLTVPVLDGAESATDGGGGGSAVAAVRDALSGLGYGTEEIRDTLRDLPSDADSETLLRDALKSLGARNA
ncbi:MAG: Holliday junction branch migration protein RuvA [Actinomycetota bacterium]